MSSEDSNRKALSLSRAIGLYPINGKKPRGLGKSGQTSDRAVKHKVNFLAQEFCFLTFKIREPRQSHDRFPQQQ